MALWLQHSPCDAEPLRLLPQDPTLLKPIPLLLWQYCGSSGAMRRAHKLFLRIKSSLFSPDRWGNEPWNAGPSFWNHRILLFYRRQHWHLEKSRAPQATCTLQWLEWGSFPTKTQLALLSLRPGYCSVPSPVLFSASFSPSPTGLLADLRTYQGGAHLRAFAHAASLVWNALCPDFHIIWSLLIWHLLKEILTLVFSIPFSCFTLWLRPAVRPHLCLLLPFLRQHHFFMTSPPLHES